MAAGRERREPHSNRPLAMTQQHAARRRSPRATTGRRRGAARRGLEGGETRTAQGRQDGRGRARPPARRVGARPLRRYRCAPAHCPWPPEPPSGARLAPPRLAAGALGTWCSCGRLDLKCLFAVFRNGGSVEAGFFFLVASGKAERALAAPLISVGRLRNENACSPPF